MEALLVVVVIGMIVALVRQTGTLSRLESQIVVLRTRLSALEEGRPTVQPPEAAAPQAADLPPQPEALALPPETAVPSNEASAPNVEGPVPPVPETSAADETEPWPTGPSPAPVDAGAGFDWERFIGLRLPVWLGAIALCVAGYFFVSYAIESGFFTPEMRVLSAATAALAFLAGAEFVRRRVTTGNPAAIASALGAASIATAYATVFLATRVYNLYPSGVGFIATIAVTLVAIAIALAYGQVVALVGMLGGYVAPVLYGGGAPNAAFLAVYLTAITAASYAVIARKSWWALSLVGLIGPALWALVWAATPALVGEAYWGSALLIGLPVIVTLATWRSWRDESDLRDNVFSSIPSAPRLSLLAAVILSALGFVLFLTVTWGDTLVGHSSGLALWQGLILYGALLVALGFASAPHRALQLPVLIASLLALLLWPSPDPTAASVVIAALALIYGFGALDQFRRLHEPALWAAVLAGLALLLFGLGLFKIAGWAAATEHKHLWALGALALAAAFVVLLRSFGPQIADDTGRSATYAAWGGTVTTLVSLAVVLELDPLYFPAAAAVAILGLAAVHLRVPVRGLRVIAAVYLGLYLLLLLGALAFLESTPAYYPFVFAPALPRHALVVLALPGLSLLLAATLFQRQGSGRTLLNVLDVTGMAALALGLLYLINPSRDFWAWSDMYLVGGQVAAAELVLAASGVLLGRRFGREAAYVAGLGLAALVTLAIFGLMILPLLAFWPAFAVPGAPIFNVGLLALGLPATLLFATGWLVRQDARASFRALGIAISVAAVFVTYALLVVLVRQAWHAGAPTLQGDMSQSEFYAYSAVTLAYGLVLLGGGVLFRHRGARALSFIFVLAATLKVFLVDAAELEGLWRVLSFLLMGLAFLGISWAYARFVFGIGVGQKPPPAS